MDEHPLVADQALHCVETEVGQELPQASFGVVEVAIVTKLAEPPRGQPRLLRIDLPWMEIKDRGLPFDTIQAGNAPTRPCVGKNSEIPATGRFIVPSCVVEPGTSIRLPDGRSIR